MPGDILRLDRASTLGSREWTLKAGSSPATSETPAEILEPIVNRTEDLDVGAAVPVPKPQPRFKQGYLDDRLYTCRAVVLGTESEPLRIKEKTKRRQRRLKKVKSKHRYTILKIREVVVKELAELEKEA